MAADDDVGARCDELLRELSLIGRRALLGARCPSAGTRRRCRTFARASRTACRSLGTSFADASPGLSRAGGPGRDELVVEHLRRADDGDPLRR